MFEWWNEFCDKGPDPISRWYKKADNYWDEKKPTVNAMLGGFGRISNTDISGSKKYLEDLGSKNLVSFGKAIGKMLLPNVL